jgi:hypothetical protein
MEISLNRWCNSASGSKDKVSSLLGANNGFESVKVDDRISPLIKVLIHNMKAVSPQFETYNARSIPSSLSIPNPAKPPLVSTIIFNPFLWIFDSAWSPVIFCDKV